MHAALDNDCKVLQAISSKLVASRLGEQKISDCLKLLAAFPKFIIADVQTQLYLVNMMCGTDSIIIRADVSDSLSKIVSHECSLDAKETINQAQVASSAFLRLIWQQLIARI